jgi:alkylated DNA nucleotide flippase Atl1
MVILMQTKSRNPTERTTWQWDRTSESEPQLIPKSWAENGRWETADTDQCLFYALEVRTGVVLEYETTASGQITGLPRRERQALRVLYVREDGQRAIVRQIITTGNITSTIKPDKHFRTIIAKAESAGKCYTNDQSAKSAINELYGG